MAKDTHLHYRQRPKWLFFPTLLLYFLSFLYFLDDDILSLYLFLRNKFDSYFESSEMSTKQGS